MGSNWFLSRNCDLKTLPSKGLKEKALEGGSHAVQVHLPISLDYPH